MPNLKKPKGFGSAVEPHSRMRPVCAFVMLAPSSMVTAPVTPASSVER